MRLPRALAAIGLLLSAVPMHVAAEDLTGAARRAYETATREGALSTACSATSSDFVFWAGSAPSTLEVEGKTQPVRFVQHKVGDYVGEPFRCQTASGPLTLKIKLTHSISNVQCGAGNRFIATFAVARLGAFSDDFLVDGCGGTSGVLIQGRRVLLCRMPDDGAPGVGQCAEAADALGPRRLH